MEIPVLITLLTLHTLSNSRLCIFMWSHFHAHIFIYCSIYRITTAIRTKSGCFECCYRKNNDDATEYIRYHCKAGGSVLLRNFLVLGANLSYCAKRWEDFHRLHWWFLVYLKSHGRPIKTFTIYHDTIICASIIPFNQDYEKFTDQLA